MNAVVGSAMAYFFLPFQYPMFLDTLQKSTPEGQEKAPSKTGDFVRLRDFTDTCLETQYHLTMSDDVIWKKNHLMIPVLPGFQKKMGAI